MRYSNPGREPGDKLIPKLISAVSQSVIATKRGLGPLDHLVRVTAAQDIIDRAGREIADLHRPLVTALLEAGGENVDPMAREFMERAASGQHQWEAIAGFTGGAASGAISSLLNNYLADPVRNLISRLPSLAPDIGTIAQLYAKGWIDEATADYNSSGQGYSDDWFALLFRLAQTWPDLQTLLQFYRRTDFSWEDVQGSMVRVGFPAELFDYYSEIRNELITVQDAALGVLRTDLTLEQGQAIAAQNGYTSDDFSTIILNTGEPPGIMQLLEAFRRGFIDEDMLKLGIAQSRVRNQWTDTILALRYEPMSTADAVQAYVQSYLSHDDLVSIADQNGLEPGQIDTLAEAFGDPLSRTEMTDLVNWGFADLDQYDQALRESRLKDKYIDLAEHLLKRPMTVADAVEASVQGYLSADDADTIMSMNGLRDQDREILRLTAGEPLSKTEMLTLWRRGIVTEDQVKDALRQSRLKDSYIDLALNLKTELPGLYDIRLMVQEAAIDDATATKLLLELGYPSDLVSQLVTAFSGATSTASKAVTEGMLADLYLETAIDQTEFMSALQALGYSPANAALIIEVNDWKAELAARNALMAKVRAQYVGQKIDENTARTDLLAAFIPGTVVDKVLADWDLEIAANVKLLSAAEVATAWQMGLFESGDDNANTQDALAYLQKLGYTAGDAYILLEIKNKGPLQGANSGNSAANPPNASGT